jgi:arylsulfatase A-like enzyme
VDQHIEELYRLFGWDRNTLVVITSDHGEELWDHGFMGHGFSLYREVIHVPLMFYYPQGGFKNRRIKNNVSLIDVLPTLREFIGMPEDKHLEGISLLPFLVKDRSDIPDRFLFGHLVDFSFSDDSVAAESTIYGKWHFIKDFSGNWHLFNLKLDPREKYNQRENDFGMARQLSARYRMFKTRSRKFKQDSAVYTLDEKQLERLKTLGYVK